MNNMNHTGKKDAGDILILVDVQNGFTKKYTVEKIPLIEDLLSRRLFDTVIATKYWNTPDSNISRLMGWKDLCTEAEQDRRSGRMWIILRRKIFIPGRRRSWWNCFAV